MVQFTITTSELLEGRRLRRSACLLFPLRMHSQKELPYGRNRHQRYIRRSEVHAETARHSPRKSSNRHNIVTERYIRRSAETVTKYQYIPHDLFKR
jgi:hypothetical protein